MKAIKTKYLGPTNTRGIRVKATDCHGNNCTVEYNHEFDSEINHERAMATLCQKMNWKGRMIGGGLKDCMVWVFLPQDTK